MLTAAGRLGKSARPTPYFALVSVILLAMLYALTILDVPFILGTAPFWAAPGGERLTYLVGALYLAHDAWRLPVFYVPTLGFPEGVNVVYTDSLPLIALALKLIYKLSGVWFNYFGLWVFLCFPLLGFFAARAAREAGLKHPISMAAAALFAIACPAFLFRFMHTALMSHFLIVWAVYLYLRLRNCPASLRAAAQFCIVASLTVLLNAYFLMMVLPFLVAALAQNLVEKRVSLRRAAITLGSAIAILLIVGLLAGLVGPGAPRATAGGFGFWSMNLLSPLIPPRAHLPEFLARFIHWERRGLTWDATGGQYEGYSYLGGGVLLLALVNLALSGRLLVKMIARHAFLALLLVGYALVAISNQVFIGDWHAASVPLPETLDLLVSYFRSAGRFIWPIYYVVMLGLVVLTFKRFEQRTARILVIASVALQLADTQLLRDGMAADATQPSAQSLSKQDWRPLLAAHRFFKQYPSFQCGGWAGSWPGNDDNMELLWEVAKLDKPTNSTNLGRNNRDCDNELVEGLKFEIEPDGLYVFGGDFPIVSIEQMPSFRTWCREFSHGVVCSRKWDTLPQLAASSTFKPITRARLAPYRLGDTLNFSTGGTGKEFFAYGWSSPEAWGTWSTGKKSELMLGIPVMTTDAILTVLADAFVHPRTPVKEFRVIVNDKPLANWTFILGYVPSRHSVVIPKDILADATSLRIAFVPSVVETPAQLGIPDRRPIGLRLIELTVWAEKQKN